MKSNRQSFLWLALGTSLMLFANGRWIIPVATWLYPIFFLRFMRLQKPVRGFILVALASAFVNSISWWKMIPVPIVFYFIVTCISYGLVTLSFLADRLIATRFTGFLSTLVFPVTWCSLEYLSSFSIKGTWAALAYSQADNLPLLQLASITGIWGIAFLITWFASVVHWAWDQQFEWIKISKGSIIFASVAATAFLFGDVRINFFAPGSQTVRTASIVNDRTINTDLSTCKWTDAKAISSYSTEVENNLLDKTREAAQAGAKMVLWQEGAGFIPKQEEAGLISRAMTLAAREKIYLLITLWSVPEDFPQHLVQNKLIIIDPDGKERLTYFKNNPAPPEPIIKGDGTIPALETPYGKIAPAICFDAEFQNFIRQAGKDKVAILFLPSNDWKEIDPIHSQMAIMRAIENGFSLVRPAGQGLSVSTDYHGKIISSMDYYTTHEQVMYADIPIEHTSTIYAQVGDVFAWLCMAGFVTTLLSGIFSKRALALSS